MTIAKRDAFPITALPIGWQDGTDEHQQLLVNPSDNRLVNGRCRTSCCAVRHEASVSHPSPIEVVAALDRAWQAIRVRHEGVPPVVLLLGPCPTRRGAKRRTRGHFLPFAWSLRGLPTRAFSTPDPPQSDIGGEDGIPDGCPSPETILRDAVRLRNELFSVRPEVFIATELLADGAAGVFGVLLHEAAHAIAATRDIKDTSRQGRYHNSRFKLIAEEVGLAGTRDPEIGWSLTALTATTALNYMPILEKLDDALGGLSGLPDRAAAARSMARCAAAASVSRSLAGTDSSSSLAPSCAPYAPCRPVTHPVVARDKPFDVARRENG